MYLTVLFGMSLYTENDVPFEQNTSCLVVATAQAIETTQCTELSLYTGQFLRSDTLFLMTPDEIMPNGAQKARCIFCYGSSTQLVYDYRVRAYENADVCLSIHVHVVKRLMLLHPCVVHVDSTNIVAKCTELCFLQQTSGKHNCSTTSAGFSFAPSSNSRTLVFVVHHFAVGGLERVVIDLMRIARKRGIRPVLVYGVDIVSESAHELDALGLEYCKLPESTSGKLMLLRQLGAIAVNAHYATLLHTECRELGIPFIQTIHNMYIWLQGEAAEEWRRMDANTAAYIAVSANAARVADGLGLDCAKMLIIPNGSRFRKPSKITPSTSATNALRHELGIPRHAALFTNVASITSAKGQLLFAHALAQALSVRDDIYGIILGKVIDPTYEERLLATIRRLGIENHLLLAGFRNDVSDVLHVSTAAVFPSYYEGWSLAISEALSLGVPVIATDVGGAAEQLRGTTGPHAGCTLLPSPLSYTQSGGFDLSVITREDYQEQVCTPLASAMLQAAQTPPQRGAVPVFSMDAENAVLRHLDVVEALTQKKEITFFRSEFFLPQRQNGFKTF